MADQIYGPEWYEQKCGRLRDALLARSAATPQEISAYWPGGAENRLTGLDAWILCYGTLTAYLWRTHEAESEDDPEAIEQLALDMMRDKPVAVELVRPLSNGWTSLTVYPKSDDALTFLDELEAENRWALERITYWSKQWEGAAVKGLTECMRARAELDLYAVWTVTQEGTQTPFAPNKEWPDLLPWLRELETADILNVLRAHLDVNAKRIRLLAATLRPDPGTSRSVGWATLKVRAADELKMPLDHLTFMRSRASWFAQFVVLAKAREADAEKAKAA